MKPSSNQDLLTFYRETIAVLKAIEEFSGRRNKTLKMKAISSIVAITKARLDAAEKYTKAGGKTEFDVVFQQQMYNPIIEWLAEEVSK